MRNIVQRPLITEKSLGLASRGWYTFAVAAPANKNEIAVGISSLYKVTVVDVRTVRVSGKTRRVGKRQRPVRKADWKKALVRLAKGQTISAFETTKEEPKA